MFQQVSMDATAVKVHCGLAMTLTFASDLENLSSNYGHLHDDHLCRVSLKLLHDEISYHAGGVNERTNNALTDSQTADPKT